MKAITDINDPRLVKALAHPLRVQILGQLQDRVASPSDLARDLEAPLGNVSYHVRILAKLELIKLVKKQPRRGAIEHMYKAVGRVRVSDRAWAQVPSIVKEAMVGSSLEQAVQYVEQAVLGDGFERPESHMSRQPMLLDELGWEELSRAVKDLGERADEIGRESDARLRADGGRSNGIDVGLVMMFFEAAAPEGRAAGDVEPAEGDEQADDEQAARVS